ncbi:MAG: hypothetical protein JSS72_08585 [Armatimonadetes bacterium]|nr:hypothetical protein [Armatimonadota bacterium]
MNERDFYTKLVDLYAGRELGKELEEDLLAYAEKDPALKQDMESLRSTVDVLRNQGGVDFTEESYQRVLMKIYSQGVEFEPRRQAPSYLQYHLPLQG